MHNQLKSTVTELFPSVTEHPSTTEKAKTITDSILKVLDEGSKIGIRVLVVYITLDTWRKIAIIAANRKP